MMASDVIVVPADMITAHSSYWGDSSLAAFILAEIFARKEDLARTGLGLALTKTAGHEA